MLSDSVGYRASLLGRRWLGVDAISSWLLSFLLVGIIDNARDLKGLATMASLMLWKWERARRNVEVWQLAPCFAVLTHLTRTTSMGTSWTLLNAWHLCEVLGRDHAVIEEDVGVAIAG